MIMYDNGDLGHLDSSEAATAVALALATHPMTSPPLRALRRLDADAHLREESALASRPLARHSADAHSDVDESLERLLREMGEPPT